MKSMRQLFRRPGKTLLGIVFVALAAAILVVCAGQYLAAARTRSELEDNYCTVALTTEKYKWNGAYYVNPLPSEYSNWILETAEAHPELVKAVSDTGLLSAYIPELEPDNYTRHFTSVGNKYDQIYGEPYSCAVLEVTLTEVGTEVREEKLSTYNDYGQAEVITGVSFLCRGTVERAVSLQEGYNDPAGYTIDLTVRAGDVAGLEAMGLQVGGRYLVYGMDYYDNDWLLRTLISENEENFRQPFDMSKVFTEHPEGLGAVSSIFTYYYYENTVDHEKTYVRFGADKLPLAQSCRLTVCDYSSLPDYVINSGDNNVLTIELLSDRRLLLENENSVPYRVQGTTKVVPAAEYMADYGVPTAARLEGTAEEFLESEAGAVWQRALASAEINYHAFPVLAVEKLGYQAEFAREQAGIVEGRDFSREELEAGERVCILSQSLAVSNGLTVGDTVTLRSYAYDPNVNEAVDVTAYPGLCFPDPAFYSAARGFAGEPEEYTIVGLYRQENAWQGGSSYGFTPNTVFIPKASANSCMIAGTEGIFRSYVLENGAVDAFKTLEDEAGYSGLLVYYDQGYSRIKADLDAYEAVSGRALYLGIAVFAGLLILYMLLFPLRQGKALATMSSLGAGRGRKLGYIMAGNLGVWVPGTVLGVLAGMRLWDKLTGELAASVGAELSLAPDLRTIFIIAAAQLLSALLMLFFAALLQTGEKNSMKREV